MLKKFKFKYTVASFCKWSIEFFDRNVQNLNSLGWSLYFFIRHQNLFFWKLCNAAYRHCVFLSDAISLERARIKRLQRWPASQELIDALEERLVRFERDCYEELGFVLTLLQNYIYEFWGPLSLRRIVSWLYLTFLVSVISFCSYHIINDVWDWYFVYQSTDFSVPGDDNFPFLPYTEVVPVSGEGPYGFDNINDSRVFEEKVLSSSNSIRVVTNVVFVVIGGCVVVIMYFNLFPR